MSLYLIVRESFLKFWSDFLATLNCKWKDLVHANKCKETFLEKMTSGSGCEESQRKKALKAGSSSRKISSEMVGFILYHTPHPDPSRALSDGLHVSSQTSERCTSGLNKSRAFNIKVFDAFLESALCSASDDKENG